MSRYFFYLILLLLAFGAGYLFNSYYAIVPLEQAVDGPAQPGLLVAKTEPADRRPLNTAPGSEGEAAYTPEELHTIQLFERATPSVCFINTSTLTRDWFTRDITEIPRGSGSGFVWDSEGHIITNYHVVQKADRATVTLGNGETYPATLVGKTPEKDLAVLRIEAPASSLPPIPRGRSENLRVGQSVYAIGNPFGLDQTLTTGVVSALEREINSVAGVPIRGAIQSDAAINPGNSGGPLLDSNGKLIGVNTAIYSPSGASAGIGFSIPVDVVNRVVPDLIRYGKLNRPTLGIEITKPLRNIEGVAIFRAVPDGTAARAGLTGLEFDDYGNLVALGDVIMSVNQQPIRSSNDLYLELEKYQPGERVSLEVIRDGRKRKVDLRLDASVND
ncbi:MAG: trypsin-like peptidase domain-containing protein [Saprospiraceae bacterium]